jgi:hypothetical protein
MFQQRNVLGLQSRRFTKNAAKTNLQPPTLATKYARSRLMHRGKQHHYSHFWQPTGDALES